MTREFLDFLHDTRDTANMAGHDGYTRYTLRIPDALYERIKRAAGEKSINAEILAVLDEKYPAPMLSSLEGASTLFLVKELAIRLTSPAEVPAVRSAARDLLRTIHDLPPEVDDSTILNLAHVFMEEYGSLFADPAPPKD